MAKLSLQRVLYRWAKDNAQNTAQLRCWLDEAINAIAENKGGQIVSATVNGSSFSSATGGMTNVEWAAVLDQVIQHIDNDTAPVCKVTPTLW